MKKYILLVFIFTGVNLFAQYDENARSILKATELRQESIKSMDVKFSIEVINSQAHTRKKDSGSAVIQKEKYIMNYASTVSYYDGKTLYSYLPEEEEVTISEPDKTDNNLLNVTTLFNVYKLGHKYAYEGEVTINKVVYYLVKLSPEDLKANYSFITLKVNKNTLDPYSLTYHKKNGVDIDVVLYSIKINIKIDPNMFTFVVDDDSDIDVIDMRE